MQLSPQYVRKWPSTTETSKVLAESLCNEFSKLSGCNANPFGCIEVLNFLNSDNSFNWPALQGVSSRL